MLDHSINLARRLSARNEADLLPFDFNNVEIFTPEESFVDDDDDPTDKEEGNGSCSSSSSYSLNYCEAIIAKISSSSTSTSATTSSNNLLSVLPKECSEYPSIREALIRRRDSEKHDNAVAFMGMHSGQAVSAMAARERGHLNPIQIQRRFTHRNGGGDRRVW